MLLWPGHLRARALSPALKIATMALALDTKDEKHRDWKQINLWKMLGLIFWYFHPCVMQAYLHILVQIHLFNYAPILRQRERERESEIGRIEESSYVSMVSIHQWSLVRSELACKLLQQWELWVHCRSLLDACLAHFKAIQWLGKLACFYTAESRLIDLVRPRCSH